MSAEQGDLVEGNGRKLYPILSREHMLNQTFKVDVYNVKQCFNLQGSTF